MSWLPWLVVFHVSDVVKQCYSSWMSPITVELCVLFSVMLISPSGDSCELWFASVVGFPRHGTITISRKLNSVESSLMCMKWDPRLITAILSYPITHYPHSYGPRSVSWLLLLFSVPESTTGIGNWNDRRAQPQQGGSEMGYPSSPGAQKHHPQSAGRLPKSSFTDFICCSSPLHERGATARN